MVSARSRLVRPPLAALLLAVAACGGSGSSDPASPTPSVAIQNNLGRSVFRSGNVVTFTAMFAGPVFSVGIASFCQSTNGTVGITNGAMQRVSSTIWQRTVTFGSTFQTNSFGKGDGTCTFVVTATPEGGDTYEPSVTSGGTYEVDNTTPVTTVLTVNGTAYTTGMIDVPAGTAALVIAGTNEAGASVAVTPTVWGPVTQPTSTTWTITVPKSAVCPNGPVCGGQNSGGGWSNSGVFYSTDAAGNLEQAGANVYVAHWY